MASPTSSLPTVDVVKEQSKINEVQNVSKKENPVETSGNIEHIPTRTITSPYNHQITNDATSPPTNADIPQWKRDLILRRRTNIAKTLANQNVQNISNSSKEGIMISAGTLGALSPTTDLKSPLIFSTNNNSDNKLSQRASNANTTYDTKMNASQNSIIASTTINNTLKTPAMIPQDEIETSCGGHYTQVNNKSIGGSHNYTEKLAPTATARTASVIQPEQPQAPVTRSFGSGIVIEYNHQNTNNDPSPTLPRENVRFRKNSNEQHGAANTTSSDSLITSSTSRLSSSLKVAAAAEIYKKSNKDNSSNVCVSEQQSYSLLEPALNSTNVGSNNNSTGGGDDEPQLHHQLRSEHESDNLSSCASVNEFAVKEIDIKINKVNSNNTFSTTKVINNNSNNNKKPCGIATASVRTTSSQYIKNSNSSLVSTHHNHKINTKARLNQNLNSSLSVSGTSCELTTTTTAVTNNKKKMVAVQEMNEITNNEFDFDPSEELQYGPGIVSKLRCRYLSLALRQSMGKQRLSLDTLRRATSLNNLLDDNDVHDEDDEDDDARNKEVGSSTSSIIVENNAEMKGTANKSNETIIGFKKHVQIRPGEKVAGTTLAYNNQNRSRHVKRGNDSLKRARSVEALLCEKSPWNFSNSQPTTLNNGSTDSVTIEDKINNARDRLLMGTDSNPPKRLTSIIDDTERPPPDLVKQTLKIFEATANRKGRVVNRNSGGEVASKVANYKSIITQNKPTINFPKPPISPKKSNLKTNSTENNKSLSSTPPTTPTTIPLVQTEKNSVPLSSTPSTNTRPIPAFRQKIDFTPIRNNNTGLISSTAEGLSDNSPDIIPRHKLLDKTLPAVVAVDSPVTDLTKKIEKLRIESPTTKPPLPPPHKEFQNRFSNESSDRDSEEEKEEKEDKNDNDKDNNDDDDDDDSDDSIDGEYEVNSEECTTIKQISKSALENIAKAGTSQQFQFQTKSSASLSNGNTFAKFSESLHDIPSLPSGGTSTVKQIGVIRPLLAEPQSIENNCIEEISTIQTTTTTTLTSREIEKNRINNEKKIEKSSNSMDTLSSSGLSKVENTNAATQSPAWSSAIITKKKRNPVAPVAENNTMVFNFKDRKEVPDYIENDGLIFKRKRELPKPNESGFVLLGDLSLETSTDPDDEWPMCPPSPCDVEFENAHIIIDGKSSIKNRPKDAHFRVQFNDTLTSTFEYPSESSVIEDTGSDYVDYSSNEFDASTSTSSAPLNLSDERDSPIVHHHVAVDEIIQLPQNNKGLGNLSLGSAPLGSYTPVKERTENIFQLGVTRVPNSQSEKSSDESHSKELPSGDFYGEPSLEYIKPASDDLTIAYSEGSLKTDLLY